MISGDDLLRKIHEIDPLNFRGIKRCINQLENEIPSITLDWDGNPKDLIRELKDILEKRLLEEIPTLGPNERSSVCSHTISRWLALCPLDFEVQ